MSENSHSEQPKTRKVRSDKGVPRGKYKPRTPKEPASVPAPQLSVGATQ
jgi:hypothetical protein